MAPTDKPAAESAPPADISCLWCEYTDGVLKKVLNHMESAHYGPNPTRAL
jgi:hypothetical protein